MSTPEYLIYLHSVEKLAGEITQLGGAGDLQKRKDPATRLAVEGFFRAREEREDLVEEAYVERLKEMAGVAGHSHLASGCRDFVVAGDEAADAGAVDDREAGQVENDRLPAPAKEAF